MNERLKKGLMVVMLTIVVSAAHASPTTCSGKIWNINETWLEIGHGLYQCSAKVESRVGRKILSVCKLGERCTFQVEVAPRSRQEMSEQDGIMLDERDRLISVRRGALDDTGWKGFEATVQPRISADRVLLPSTFLGDWCFIPTQGGTADLYDRGSHEACRTSWLNIRQDGYDGQDGNSGPKMACRAAAITVKIIPDFHDPSSKYFNNASFSDHYTIRSQCGGEGSSWQEKKTMYIEKGLLTIEPRSGSPVKVR
jgi:hypothetical protein